MNSGVVIDTNVAIVANGHATQAGIPCVETCVATLIRLRERYRILLDDRGLILDEYRRRLSPSGQPGPGDAFFKWLWDNQCNLEHCWQLTVVPTESGSFEEFPDDPGLEGFDKSDRKFVAVAIASQERPPILNASDTDWWEHREALRRHGIEVRFLCPELMKER
jgi:hypothetical protein